MRIRKKVVLLLAAALGAAGLSAVPAASAAADPGDTAEVHGLKGEYYTQSAPGAFDFGQLKATGFDPDIDFPSLESRLSSATGQADDASIRWTGKIVPEKTGSHVFSMIGDNGFRLWIDGKPVIDHWVDDWEKEQTSQPVELTAGKAYDFKVEYFEHFGGSNLHLQVDRARWHQGAPCRSPPSGCRTTSPTTGPSVPPSSPTAALSSSTSPRSSRPCPTDSPTTSMPSSAVRRGRSGPSRPIPPTRAASPSRSRNRSSGTRPATPTDSPTSATTARAG